MLGLKNKNVAIGLIALSVVAISLPIPSIAAISPTVSVLSPLVNGLRAPVRMVLDAAGNVCVADQRAGGVVKFDAYGAQLPTIRTSTAPTGIAFAQDGSLLVSQGTFVARYDVVTGQETGRLIGGQLQSSAGIAVDDVTGYIYVADSRANQIEMYTASGAYVKAFAKGISANAAGATVINPLGKLSMPTGIAFEKVSRQLAVADTLGNRIQFFDVDGNFVKSIGNAVSTLTGASVAPMQFAAPVAVAFEYSKGQSQVLNRIYVVDAFQGNIQVVDPVTLTALTVTGTSKNYIGSSGIANGQLLVPSDAVFDAANSRLMVVNGSGNITIYGVDGGKNPVYVDLTPPIFTLNQVPVEVIVNTLVLGGTVEDGSTVQLVSDSTAQIGAVTYSGSSWGAVVTGLVAGDNIFTVTAKDVAGNVAAAQVATVSYVLPAPAIAVDTQPSLTKSTAVVLSGTVDSGSTVDVANQTTNVTGNAVVSGNTWSYDLVLTDGQNAVRVTAKKAHSAMAAVSLAVTLDNVAPLLNVSALADGSYTSTPVQNISGTVVDANGATVTLNGVSAILSGNAFSVPVSLLNGANLISVVAVDAAGNATVDNRTVYFDASKPFITVQNPVDNSLTSNTIIKINGTVDKVSTVTVAGLPAIIDGNNWNASVDLVAGVNTIDIVATDLYGNSSSLKRSITLDAAKPNLAVVTPGQDLAISVPNVLIGGTVSDTNQVALEYTVNGVTTAVPVTAGVYSFNVDFSVEGNYPVTVTAMDAAGNFSTVVRNVIYDITPPAFTLNQVNGVMPEKLSGTVEAGSSVVVKDGSVPIGVVAIVDGTWSADLAGVSYSPDKLLAVATDAAGNSTSKTLAYNYPDGALNGGKPTIQDALRAIRIVVNHAAPTAQELAHYDIAPLVNGKPNPNGRIEIVDAILILRKALGLQSW